MALPVTPPYVFGNVTSSIPLTNLDADFATIYAAVNGIGNGTVSLANVTITGGSIQNVAFTLDSINNTPIGNVTPSTAVVTSLTDTGLTAGRVNYNGTGGLLVDSANMTFDGSTLTTLNSAYTGTLTGGTGIVNLGSGQFYKDASGNVGIGTTDFTYGELAVNGSISINSSSASRFAWNNAGAYYNWIESGGGAGTTFMRFATGNAESMRIDSSGNVGIGTSSPASKLNVYQPIGGGGQSASIFQIGNNSGSGSGGYAVKAISKTDNGGGSQSGYCFYASSPYDGTNATGNTYSLVTYGLYVDDLYSYYGKNSTTANTNFGLYVKGGGVNYISNNLGIGSTPNPSWSTTGAIKCISMFSNGSAIPSALYSSGGGSNGSGLVNNGYNNGSGWYYDYSSSFGSSRYELNGGIHYWYIAGAGTGGNAISYTQAMTLDSSGNLLVGTTTVGTNNSNSFTITTASGAYSINHANGTASGSYYCGIGYNGTLIGSITQSGTTAVLFNTTSDYRLKTDVTPIQNALSTVEALNPVSFTWIDGRKDDGFLAHEIQAVIPNCVTGEKDAVNEDGTPKYQQMDNSGVIPFLVKAIQEQQTLITDLQARLTKAGL